MGRSIKVKKTFGRWIGFSTAPNSKDTEVGCEAAQEYS